MKSHQLGFILIVLFGLSTVLAEGIDEIDDEKIVGGTNARFRYSYQVSLRTGNFHNCGGSIINQLWIVTAAHCLSTINKVYAGSNLLSTGNAIYDIARKIPHPQYKGGRDFDIAVVRTSRAIVFNVFVGKIDLPVRDIGIGQTLLVTGWGRTSTNGPIPNILQELPVRTISTAECAARLGSAINGASILCTFNSLGRGLCQGDSGGPLVQSGRLYGVVSAVVPCAVGFPDLQTRVFTFVPWILRTARG